MNENKQFIWMIPGLKQLSDYICIKVIEENRVLTHTTAIRAYREIRPINPTGGFQEIPFLEEDIKIWNNIFNWEKLSNFHLMNPSFNKNISSSSERKSELDRVTYTANNVTAANRFNEFYHSVYFKLPENFLNPKTFILGRSILLHPSPVPFSIKAWIINESEINKGSYNVIANINGCKKLIVEPEYMGDDNTTKLYLEYMRNK